VLPRQCCTRSGTGVDRTTKHCRDQAGALREVPVDGTEADAGALGDPNGGGSNRKAIAASASARTSRTRHLGAEVGEADGLDPFG
jgi:hypothetical protein